jgi:phosphonate transport system ATP-binding protein
MEEHAQDRTEIIEARDLIKTYPKGVRGLDGLNLKIYKGEMVGILGASGSGKTTLFRLLNGSIIPTQGELHVLGKPYRGQSSRALRQLRTQISLIYQHHNIIPGLTVARNVLLGRLGRMTIPQIIRMAFYLSKAETEDVYRVLERLDLGDKMFDRATDLSGGQQQRVAIARTLLSNSQVILADEPIASVDSTTAAVILDLFKQLNREKNVTVVMNLHQEDFALNYCSRVVVLGKGKLLYDGPPDNYANGGREYFASKAL